MNGALTARFTAGTPAPLGVTLDERGANVAVLSADAEAIELCLFDDADRETARLRLPERTGAVFHGHVAGLTAGQRYGLRAYGPYDPANGLRFNPHKLLIDPYARAIDRPFVLHPAMFGYRRDDSQADLSFSAEDSAPVMPKAIMTATAMTSASTTARPATPWADTLLYELHVRGFTRQHAGVPEALRGTFAGLGSGAAIDHLLRLGITAVEIMPAAAWIDERHLAALGLTNYWGYNPVALMAAEPRLAPGGFDEIRAAVERLHEAGIEVILDVVLNHTGEGDELGPTLSLRGLDNRTYYRLRAGEPRRYIDDAGCGNVLALDRAPVVELTLAALRHWVRATGIDGFRFDLATMMLRSDHGVHDRSALIAAIEADPLLASRKLIAEPWDVGPGGYRLGTFGERWHEWNDRFRDTARRFWRGDGGLIGEMATRWAGSSDLFARRSPAHSINFITAHDGFTLADLVAHERKHNAANGEGNRDGSDSNHSWNNGVEGETGDGAILARRQRDQRNLLATLLFARGTPMMAMGTELGHSHGGNNNVYAQDNATAWLDWPAADTGLLRFAMRAIALRKAHPTLRRDVFLTGTAVDAEGLADVQWLRPDGHAMADEDWHDHDRRVMTIVLAQPETAMARAERLAIVLSAQRATGTVTLPQARDGCDWTLRLDTSQEDGETPIPLRYTGGATIPCDGPCVLLFEETAQESTHAARSRDADAQLAHLSRTAGIALQWHDIAGAAHDVSVPTQRAILAGLGLAADGAGDVRISLERLSALQARRPLPASRVAQAGGDIPLRLAWPQGLPFPRHLQLRDEAGTLTTLALNRHRQTRVTRLAPDGTRYEETTVVLPPQPVGCYRLSAERHPEWICHLSVVPARCYLPEEIGQARAFGIATQLYALRGENDQGIGDFTVLGDYALAAAGHGAATIGLNPLHALFAGDRSRASPYHPCDRCFLDPIAIDVTALDTIAQGLTPRATLSAHAAALAALRDGALVSYRDVWAIKEAALAESYATFRDLYDARHPVADAFDHFLRAGGDTLRRFAVFGTISALHAGEAWWDWPQALRDGEPGALDDVIAAHRETFAFHLYQQFLCERQLAEAAARARDGGLTLGFYRDLAVGAAGDGSEVWMNQALFMRGVSIGAPPDPFAEQGQIWNLPPPNPLAWAVDGYRSFRRLIAANMRHAGALRIDHAMGLSRLFVVPDGGRASEGAYLSYPFADLIGALALESNRARCMVIGEALGTVPDGFRDRVGDSDVLSYRVLWFERDGPAFKPPASYEAKAVACVSTHDLPTLRGWWDGADIAEKAALGLIASPAATVAAAERTRDKAALVAALIAAGLLPPSNEVRADAPLDDDLAVAIHRFVTRAASMLVMAQAEDLAGATESVNLPGTDRERPNWRRRLPDSARPVFDARAERLLAALRQGRAER